LFGMDTSVAFALFVGVVLGILGTAMWKPMWCQMHRYRHVGCGSTDCHVLSLNVILLNYLLDLEIWKCA
jgi:hypothetical protein